MAKGGCSNDIASRTVSSCNGSVRIGSYIFVDMKKIGRPCTCTVRSLFVGYLLVTSLKATTPLCNTRVTVNNTVRFNCSEVASSAFPARVNDTVVMNAEHTSSNVMGTFSQCMGLTENGGRGGKVSVMCGTPQASTTTTISTTIHLSTPVTTSAEHININIIALSAAGGIVLLVFLVVFSLIMIRRRNRKNKAESPGVDTIHSYMFFDNSIELPDNPLYAACQAVEEDEFHVTSEQSHQSDSAQQIYLKPMHKNCMCLDNNVLSNKQPLHHDTSSMSVYAVPNNKSIKHDASPVSFYAVPNNKSIKRSPPPMPVYAVPHKNI